jgi:hypothetical protein
MRSKLVAPARARKTFVNNNGYRVFKDSGTPLHRYVAEKKLGRPLKAGEVVHHKDRNKLNNSQNNLQVCSSQNAHWNMHKKDAANHGWKYSLTGKK